jgi:hypothetical protein
MELVDRYLNAVKGYLPQEDKTAQDDIIAELKDSLLSRIEEREATLGRALTAEEQQALVKENGHPMLVASRYMPQQYLIGPNMYPFWMMAMRAMLVAVGVVYAVLAVISLTTRGHVVQALIQAATGFAGTALFWAAMITLMFCIFERNQIRFGFLDRWPPAKLAANSGGFYMKRSESLFDIVIGAFFLAWWVGVINFPATFWHYGKPVSFAMSSSWNPYWWGILVLGVWWLLLSVASLISPYIKGDRLLQRILLNVFSLGLLYFLAQPDVLIVVGSNGEDVIKYGAAQDRLNQMLRGVFVVLAIIWTYEIVVDVRRLLGLRRNKTSGT